MLKQDDRKLYFDILRIIACFLVIFNHSGGYTAYQNASNAVTAFVYMFFTMITRINVPVFFMISGALLLTKDVSYKEMFFKRILRICIALLFASVVVYLVDNRHDWSRLDLGTFVRKTLGGKIRVAYWYLYAYVGFLLMLPFMRRSVKNMTKYDFIYLLVIHCVIFTLLPLGNYILAQIGISKFSISSDFNVAFMTVKAFFYPLIGYYLENVLDINKITTKHICMLLVAIVLGIGIASGFTYHQGITKGYSQDFVQTFDYVIAISVFVLIKCLFVKIKFLRNNRIVAGVVSLCGSVTFGIYLMEPVLKCYYNKFAPVLTAENPVLLGVSWCLLSMSICGVVTYLLKLIPPIKKIL